MATEISMEQRLAAVEAAVRELQLRMTILPPAANWLERISGSFRGKPAFDEVLAYGRAWRESDRPSEDTNGHA